MEKSFLSDAEVLPCAKGGIERCVSKKRCVEGIDSTLEQMLYWFWFPFIEKYPALEDEKHAQTF